jgi:hypothetical protein
MPCIIPHKYYSGDKIKKNEMYRVCSTYGEDQRCIQGFGWETQEMRSLGRPRRRWEYNIKMDLREVGWGGMDWIDVAQDTERWRALVNTVMNLRVP